jgi:hypothetical protein
MTLSILQSRAISTRIASNSKLLLEGNISITQSRKLSKAIMEDIALLGGENIGEYLKFPSLADDGQKKRIAEWVSNGADPDTKPAERAILTSSMSPSKLAKLLQKEDFTENDVESLKDYKYLILAQPNDADERGFMAHYTADHGVVLAPKDKFILTNIEHAISKFEKKDYSAKKLSIDEIKQHLVDEAIPFRETSETREQWSIDFPEGFVSTPIGKIKMGENQFDKLMANGRAKFIGLVKPTLENPTFIVKNSRDATIFVRQFVKADGKLRGFMSVSIDRDGLGIVISNHPKDMKALVKEVDTGVLLHPSNSTVKYSAADATTSLEEQHALAGGLDETIPQPPKNATDKYRQKSIESIGEEFIALLIPKETEKEYSKTSWTAARNEINNNSKIWAEQSKNSAIISYIKHNGNLTNESIDEISNIGSCFFTTNEKRALNLPFNGGGKDYYFMTAKEKENVSQAIIEKILKNNIVKRYLKARNAYIDNQPALDSIGTKTMTLSIMESRAISKQIRENLISLNGGVASIMESRKLSKAINDDLALLNGGHAANEETNDNDLVPDGKDNEVKTAKGTKIVTGFMVIEASKLIVSHDEQGNANPDYPQEMQPRDRARDTSQAQIARIAKNLDPDMLGRTRVAYQGAPIIGKDGVVESGNGRAMAITLAYKLGKADEYRAWLLDIADMYGLNPDKIEHMKRPVLVRVRKTEVDRAQFAIEANQSDMLAMTATEKAKSDAARLTDAIVSKLSIEGDLTAASNRDFIMAFLQSLGDDETAGLLTTMGQPTKQLYDRAQAAVFAKAYNDDRLLELMADAEKPEIANIIKSLNQAAQPFITARNISEHATHTATQKIGDAIDVSLDQQAVDAIIKATEMLKKAKDSGMPIEELIKQNDLFGDIDPVVAQMALFIKDNNRSPARMGAAFVAMAEFVVKELESRQNASLFDDDMAVDMVDVLKAANAQLQKQYGEDVKAIGGTGGFIDMFTETRGQKEDREAFLARESANAEQQADPAATANINAASISETLKKKAIKYLQENPESHEIKGLSAKSLNVIIENIRSALFAEVKALSPLFIEVSDTNLSLKTPSGYLNLAIYKQKGFVTGYKVDFYGGNENYTNNLFDSTSTIEELRQWGFALPFDLDVKAFVANVIKPEVDKLLSAKVVDEPVIVEDENSTIDSMLAKVKTYFTCEDPLPESVPSNWIIMNTTRPLVGTKTFENASYLHGRFYAAIDPNDEFAKQNIKSNISLDGYVIKIISSDLSSKMIKNTIPEKYLEALGRLPVDKQNQYMLDNKDKINGNTYADAMKMMKDAYSEPETENESIPIPSDSDAVIAPEGEDSSEVDRQSEEQAEEDEPMEDFEPITPEVAEPTPAITGNTEIDGYKSKLLGLQQRQDRMKAVNKIVNNKKLTSEQKKSALADAGYTSEQYMVDAKPKWSDGKLGYEGYQLTNNNANIASTKKRITQLEAQDLAASKANSGDSQTSYDFDGGTIELDYSADRLKVDFDAIPDSDMNSKLKQNGFKWSPTNRVWQRQLTDNAISTANYLFGTNIKTAATMMTEEENKPRPNPIIQAVEPVIEPITPIEPVQNETAEIEAEITEPSNNAQTEKISAYSDELDSIRQETNSIELMRRLNDIVARIEADNLMDEMDVKLNQASDAVDELFKEAQKNAV